MRAAQRPSWWFVLICYKFISKDLLNRLKKSGVDSDSVDSFRCHWIQSFERRCLGSLMKPCTESGSSGSTGDMSQMNIHESESNFARHLRPPNEWRNDDMMNAYERIVFTFPDEHSQKFWGQFEAHNLSEAFARPFQLLFLFEFVRQSECRLCSGVQEAGLLRVRAVLAVLCPEFAGVVLLNLARDWYMDYIWII